MDECSGLRFLFVCIMCLSMTMSICACQCVSRSLREIVASNRLAVNCAPQGPTRPLSAMVPPPPPALGHLATMPPGWTGTVVLLGVRGLDSVAERPLHAIGGTAWAVYPGPPSSL